MVLLKWTDEGFNLDATWTVEGTVEHWGHVHTRLNQYSARFTVAIVEGTWKITHMKVTQQKRLNYQVKIRGFEKL